MASAPFLPSATLITRLKRWLGRKEALWILLPSIVATAIFIYAFIGTSFFFSLTNWR